MLLRQSVLLDSFVAVTLASVAKQSGALTDQLLTMAKTLLYFGAAVAVLLAIAVTVGES